MNIANNSIIYCINYYDKWWHYLFPSFDIFYNVCISYDKTKYFLVSLIRFLLYLFILLTYSKYKYILLPIVTFNFVVLIMGIFKENYHSKSFL